MPTKANLSNRWINLPDPLPDVVFELDARAKAAPEPKANVAVGAYRDDFGKPMPLKTVRKAEKILMDLNMDFEYLPIEGDTIFVKEAVSLLFGKADDSPAPETIAAVQSLSGTGACRIAAEFFGHSMPHDSTHVFFSDPTWANHQAIFRESGFSKLHTYRYYNPVTKGVDIVGMLEDLTKAPENSIIVLHMCAHNPTGADPSHEEWNKIADVCHARKHQILFDSAYQGYASGDLVRDSFAARLFARRGFEFAVAQSFAKNMGLYNERVGCFSVVCSNEVAAKKVFGLLKNIIRPMYSNPPAHGARVARLILTTPSLRAEWEAELKQMSGRIMRMRKALHEELVRLKTPGNWDHILKQIGMFSYLGINREQSKALQDMRLFVMLTGRASIAGLTQDSAKLLAHGIDKVVRDPKYLQKGSKL